jgi:hypothetical protein
MRFGVFHGEGEGVQGVKGVEQARGEEADGEESGGAREEARGAREEARGEGP